MKIILVINGPNLNRLGKRNRKFYGKLTLNQINDHLDRLAKSRGVALKFFQSNSEGALIDFIQHNSKETRGILINPGALTQYGYSLRDALVDTRLPVVTVHLSDIKNREDFRKIDVFEGITLKNIYGLREKSYIKGLEILINHICKSK